MVKLTMIDQSGALVREFVLPAPQAAAKAHQFLFVPDASGSRQASAVEVEHVSMSLDELRKLKPGDQVIVAKQAWDDSVVKPDKDVICKVLYLNGTIHDAIQVMVSPLANNTPCRPLYAFPHHVRAMPND